LTSICNLADIFSETGGLMEGQSSSVSDDDVFRSGAVLPCTAMHRKSFVIFTAVAALLSLTLAARPSESQTADPQQHLRDQYQGKTFLLRDFYDGSSLRYDESGRLSHAAASGDWTVDGIVRVDDIRVSGHHLGLRATRQQMGWVRDAGFSPLQCPDGKVGEECEHAKKLNIDADLGLGEVTSDNADALLAKVFLTPGDHFAELVPVYWKPCVLAALSDNPSKGYEGCQFSPEFLSIPGVSSAPDANADPSRTRLEESPGSGHRSGTFRVGRDVGPPRVLAQTEPEFSEAARKAKYQGIVTLQLVVDSSGAPTKVHIVRPIGCGLDEKAVHTVETWKFKPAEKDGEPVAVLIDVQVDFHLY
jgi:TonB family protein